ncbi:MAG TPA: CoA-binding protein [bacterium]|nr:CoA-binding protein [bacterium]
MKDRRLMLSRMETLWHPRRVAMVGATNSMSKWGFIIFTRMLGEQFTGEIFPVNPRDEYVVGKKAYKSIADVPGAIDVAVVVTPAATVPGVLRELAQKKVPAAIVITSGFSETGPEGAAVEREMVEFARKAGMVLVGPNTMGTYSAGVRLNCLMAPVSPLAGRAACIAQSGNVGTHMLFRGRLRGLGFGKFVSSGNEGDLSLEDYLWYFGQDDETSAVLGYLEGLDPDSDFMRIAPEVTKKKPVILYKGGRTAAGASAAASHTGALAGDAAVFRSAMRQAGVIVAESNKEVVELARAMELSPVPKGPRVGILTRGGGWGVITSDACVEAGLEVPRLSDDTMAKLDKLLPAYWSRGNPVDMVAVLSNQAYLDCLDLVVKDPNVDAVIGLGANIDAQTNTTLETLRDQGAMDADKLRAIEEKSQTEGDEFVKALRDYLTNSPKPILSVGRWRETPDWESGLMMIGEPEDAARMMAKMAEYGRYLAGSSGKEDRPPRRQER